MRVKMKADISGTRNGESWPARGETLDVSDDEGAQLCAAGIATPIVDDKTEMAVVDDDSEKRLTTRTGPVRKSRK